jgi:BMFP domain-containing protein YqiC
MKHESPYYKMASDFIQELANLSARVAKLETKVMDWEEDVNTGGRIDQAFETQSEHLEAYIERNAEEIKRELRSEVAGVNAKLDIILQRLTGIISPEN